MSKVRRIHQGLDQWDEPDALNQPLPLQDNDNNLERDVRESMAVLDPVRPIVQEDDEEDEGLMELMERMEQKAAEKKDIPEDDFNEPYVPEGYEPPFSEEDYD